MCRRLLHLLLTLVVALVGALAVGALAPSTWAATPFGNALQLTGPSDWASASDSDSIDLGAAGASLTMEALVLVPDETSDANQVIFYKQSAFALSINFNTATPDVLLFDFWQSPVSRETFLISHAVTSGWHHVAASLDNHASGPDGFAIFLDGDRVAFNDTAVSVSGLNASTNVLSVGANSGAVSWDGWIDEARFSDVVRYPDATYAVPSAPFVSDGNTRALWHFDETSGSTTFGDSSAHGNTLTGNNGAQSGVPPGTPPMLAFSTASPSVGEGAGSTLVTVTRTGGTDTEVGVHYATSNGTATAGSDYTATSGDLTFTAGDTSETFSVPISQDTAVEGDETLTLTLSTPTGGAVLGSPSTATLTITDDDAAAAPVLSFSSSDYVTSEGSGSQMVTVQRTGDLTMAVGVSYATSDATATAGADYTATSGALSFGPGVGSASFTVPIVNDAIDEGTSEWLDLSLSAPTGGAVLGAPSLSRITIADDEAPPEMSFTSATYSVGEGMGSLAISVRRTGASAGAVTIGYATSDGSATAGADYQAASGEIVFMPDEPATQSFDVPVVDDAVVEADETVLLSLTSVNGGTLGDPDTATLTIQDDDTKAQLRLSASTFTVSESAGYVPVTVQRTNDTSTSVSVAYATSDGSAVAGSDYTPDVGTVSFSAGETSKTFNVLIADDAQPEGNEGFHVTLSDPQGNAVLADPSTATVTITDDDVAGATVAFALSSRAVTEDAGTVALTVSRTGNLSSMSSVGLGVGSGSAGPADFSLPSTPLVFAPGVATMSVPLLITDDARREPAETLVIALTNPGASTSVGWPSSVTVTIRPSDQQPDLWISKSAASAYLGDNVYNATGARQQAVSRASRSQARTFYVRIYNDGNVSNTFRVTGSAAIKGSKVRYLSGARDVTRAMRSAAGWKVTLRPGTYRLVKVRIAVLSGATVGSTKGALVRAGWTGDGSRVDVVKAVVKVVR
ncbi:MAG: Calx-beta domain-containing protein [Nocardioides sp.]|nr:Calx-beta domain-containing protein [Nocardioides sp.]